MHHGDNDLFAETDWQFDCQKMWSNICKKRWSDHVSDAFRTYLLVFYLWSKEIQDLTQVQDAIINGKKDRGY